LGWIAAKKVFWLAIAVILLARVLNEKPLKKGSRFYPEPEELPNSMDLIFRVIMTIWAFRLLWLVLHG